MEHPKLNLAAVGFSATQRMTVATMLLAQQSQSRHAKLPFGYPIWQLTDYRDANAMVLNLEHSEQGPDNISRFFSDPTHPNPIGVVVSDLTVPFAIAHKTAHPSAKPTQAMHFVDIDDYASVLVALRHFEAELSPLRTVFAFAHRIMDRRADLDTRKVYRLLRRTGMVAWIDLPRQTVWLRDGITPADIYNCMWQTQAATDNELSDGFSAWTMEEASWVFAQYSQENKLPKRYEEHPIFFRRRLRVRASLVQPHQLHILEQLSRKPLRYTDLMHMPTIDGRRLQRDLYALYMCRAITTDPRKIYGDAVTPGRRSHAFGPSSQATGMDHLLPAQPTIPIGLRTAPGELA
jgi:hypothetical protein